MYVDPTGKKLEQMLEWLHFILRGCEAGVSDICQEH